VLQQVDGSRAVPRVYDVHSRFVSERDRPNGHLYDTSCAPEACIRDQSGDIIPDFPWTHYAQLNRGFDPLNGNAAVGGGASINGAGYPFHPRFLEQGPVAFGNWGAGGMLLGDTGFCPVGLTSTTVPPANANRPFCTVPGHTAGEPAYAWRGNAVAGWSQCSPIPPSSATDPKWFVDVDGDGYPDVLSRNGTGTPAPGLATAAFWPTRKVIENGQRKLRPFQFDASAPLSSVTPSGGVTGASPLPWQYYFADFNGDGLPDIAIFDAGSIGVPGKVTVRFGDGRGDFVCDPNAPPSTWATNSCPIYVPGFDWTSHGAAPFNKQLHFADVTGDGLADMVEVRPETGAVRVWVNRPQLSFMCANPAGDCVVGNLVKSDGTPAWLPNTQARVAFGDMNGDGVDDVVVLGLGEFWTIPVHLSPSNTYVEGGRAPRGGLLKRVHDGRGATTDITYKTIQELDLAARSDPASALDKKAWDRHSPVGAGVVTSILVRDTVSAEASYIGASLLSEPFKVYRRTDFKYRDPAFDPWERRLLGFRKTRAQVFGQQWVTDTWRSFGPCDQPDVTQCPLTSDDVAPTGEVVRVDRYVPPNNGEPNGWVWSRTRAPQWASALTSPEPGARRIWRLTGEDTNLHVYDPLVVATVAPDNDLAMIPSPPSQSGKAVLGSTVILDARGEVTDEIDFGNSPAGTTNPPDGKIITHTSYLGCTAEWVCQIDEVQQWGEGGSMTPTWLQSETLRRVKFTWDANILTKPTSCCGGTRARCRSSAATRRAARSRPTRSHSRRTGSGSRARSISTTTGAT